MLVTTHSYGARSTIFSTVSKCRNKKSCEEASEKITARAQPSAFHVSSFSDLLEDYADKSWCWEGWWAGDTSLSAKADSFWSLPREQWLEKADVALTLEVTPAASCGLVPRDSVDLYLIALHKVFFFYEFLQLCSNSIEVRKMCTGPAAVSGTTAEELAISSLWKPSALLHRLQLERGASGGWQVAPSGASAPPTDVGNGQWKEAFLSLHQAAPTWGLQPTCTF